jgi:hypothetical protein
MTSNLETSMSDYVRTQQELAELKTRYADQARELLHAQAAVQVLEEELTRLLAEQTKAIASLYAQAQPEIETMSDVLKHVVIVTVRLPSVVAKMSVSKESLWLDKGLNEYQVKALSEQLAGRIGPALRKELARLKRNPPPSAD